MDNMETMTNLKILEQYVPIVDRVHGETHPVFHQVRSLFEAINSKIKEAGSVTPELTVEFAKLREITGNYVIPEDVCEAYEAVYRMLGELDKAYNG